MNEQIKVPKIYIDLLDQVFEIEKRSKPLQNQIQLAEMLVG